MPNVLFDNIAKTSSTPKFSSNNKINMAMQLIEQNNPQMLEKAKELLNGKGGNPKKLIAKELRNANPQQIAKFKETARNMGLNISNLDI